MGRLCYLCNYNERKKDANISLHSFPKIPITRSAWFHVCGLNEEIDDVSGIKICSQHFLSSDFFPPRNRATKRNVKTLRPGAVPSIIKVQSVRQTALRQHVASTSNQMDNSVTIKSQAASDCKQSNLLQEIVKEEADDCTQQVEDIKEEEAFSCNTEQDNFFSTGVFQKADPYIQYIKVEDGDGETCFDAETILQGYWDTDDVDSSTKSQPYTSNFLRHRTFSSYVYHAKKIHGEQSVQCKSHDCARKYDVINQKKVSTSNTNSSSNDKLYYEDIN